jgi:hypothetical protein
MPGRLIKPPHGPYQLGNVVVTNAVNFYGKILGVIVSKGALDKSDDLFRVEGTRYATGQYCRGTELQDNPRRGDIVTLSDEMRTFSVDLYDSRACFTFEVFSGGYHATDMDSGFVMGKTYSRTRSAK